MDDDLNTPMVIAELFEACGIINRINDGKLAASAATIDKLRVLFSTVLTDILGIRTEIGSSSASDSASRKPFEDAVNLLLQIRSEAKARKDWATSDLIRNRLSEIGFDVKDTKDGFEWSIKS